VGGLYWEARAIPLQVRNCWQLQAGRSLVRDPNEITQFFSIYEFLILPAALGSGDYSASNRNEYQMQKNNVSPE
jgi:hypothetical protein